MGNETSNPLSGVPSDFKKGDTVRVLSPQKKIKSALCVAVSTIV